MKRIAMVLGAITSVATVALVPNIAGASNGHQRFTVVAQDAQATVVPTDFFTAQPVQNAQGTEDAPVTRNGTTVGLAETVFTVTRVASNGDVVVMVECDIELPEGHLLFNGAVHLADVGTGASVPVVGGTGAYAGAAGTVTMVGAADGSSTSLSFDIRG